MDDTPQLQQIVVLVSVTLVFVVLIGLRVESWWIDYKVKRHERFQRQEDIIKMQMQAIVDLRKELSDIRKLIDPFPPNHS
jgi:hypothetical protein